MILKPKVELREETASVYCFMCTHTVEATVVVGPKGPKVKPGQKCARCGSSIDSGYVVRPPKAA
ncbi:MAG: hypothetical protein JNL62_20530 [Bryobacterales bacterium]|nr:hypothetical protein [Bryobacterales bacterium]